MTPETILRTLWKDGVRLELIGDDRLAAYPAERLSPGNLELCRTHKLALTDFMRAARLTTARLVDTAMEVCDQWRDGPEAREQMRGDLMSVPEHLRGELLDHLRQTYKKDAHDPPGSGSFPLNENAGHSRARSWTVSRRP
jgi:hypothetical protein